MTIQYIRDYYNLTVKVGDYITYTGCFPHRRGKVVGTQGQYLRVRFDDNVNCGRIEIVHPTWKVEYESN